MRYKEYKYKQLNQIHLNIFEVGLKLDHSRDAEKPYWNQYWKMNCKWNQWTDGSLPCLLTFFVYDLLKPIIRVNSSCILITFYIIHFWSGDSLFTRSKYGAQSKKLVFLILIWRQISVVWSTILDPVFMWRYAAIFIEILFLSVESLLKNTILLFVGWLCWSSHSLLWFETHQCSSTCFPRT